MSVFLSCFAKFGHRITELLLLEGTSNSTTLLKQVSYRFYSTLQVFNYKLYYIDE